MNKEPFDQSEFRYTVEDAAHKEITTVTDAPFFQIMENFRNVLIIADHEKTVDVQGLMDFLKDFIHVDRYSERLFKSHLVVAIDNLCRFPERFNIILQALLANLKKAVEEQERERQLIKIRGLSNKFSKIVNGPDFGDAGHLNGLLNKAIR